MTEKPHKRHPVLLLIGMCLCATVSLANSASADTSKQKTEPPQEEAWRVEAQWTVEFSNAMGPFIGRFLQTDLEPSYCGTNANGTIQVCYNTGQNRVALSAPPTSSEDLKMDHLLDLVDAAPTTDAAHFAKDALNLALALVARIIDTQQLTPDPANIPEVTERTLSLSDFLALRQSHQILYVRLAWYAAKTKIGQIAGQANEHLLPIQVSLYHIASARAAMNCSILSSYRPSPFCDLVYGRLGQEELENLVSQELQAAEASWKGSAAVKEYYSSLLQDTSSGLSEWDQNFFSEAVARITAAQDIVPAAIQSSRDLAKLLSVERDWAATYRNPEDPIWSKSIINTHDLINLAFQ